MKLYQDSIDGLGILAGEHDEIDSGERLRIKINGGGMLLSGVWITDLFDAPDGVDGEEGRVVINGAFTFDFFGNDADQGNGEIWVDFNEDILVESALFKTIGEKRNNEFSVAGFTGGAGGSAVPEPATSVLLGTALFCLAGLRKKI